VLGKIPSRSNPSIDAAPRNEILESAKRFFMFLMPCVSIVKKDCDQGNSLYLALQRAAKRKRFDRNLRKIAANPRPSRNDVRSRPRLGRNCRLLSGFAACNLTTQGDSDNSICFGGRLWGSYLRRKDRANSFANRESSSVLII
jgi:hypothetical protein